MPGFALDDPQYLGHPTDTDALMRMILELASEVWVLRDRLTLFEHALRGRDVLDAAEIEGPVVDEALAARLRAERNQLIERLLAAASGTQAGATTS